MKAYIMRSERKIEPFGDHPQDCLIVNKTLSELQKETLLGIGLNPVFISDSSQIADNEEYILFGDNLYFTPELLCEFIAKCRKKRCVAVCALKSGITTLRTAVNAQETKVYDGHIEYNLCYFPKAENRKNHCALVIEPDEFSVSIKMPSHMCGTENYLIPMTERFAIQIDHWVNLWVANIVTILAEGARLQKSSKIKFLYLALKAQSFNKWKILCQLNRIGKNCDIHPTAYIEGSIIGNGVTVGARAVVRESVIGNDSLIGNGVVVEESAVGENSTILNGHILYSVLYPGCFSVAEMVSASFVGKNVFMGLNTTLTDFRFDGKNVTALKNGVAVDSGNTFLGSCLGHGVYLGSGCIVAPGRTIPNGLRLVPCKEKTVWNSFDGQIPTGFRLVKK